MATTDATDTLDLYGLLSAVNSGEIWQDGDVSNYYLRYVFGMSDPYQNVTAEVAAAEKAGLVVLVDGTNDSRLWWLTEKGAKKLGRLRNPRLIDRIRAAINI